MMQKMLTVHSTWITGDIAVKLRGSCMWYSSVQQTQGYETFITKLQINVCIVLLARMSDEKTAGTVHCTLLCVHKLA